MIAKWNNSFFKLLKLTFLPTLKNYESNWKYANWREKGAPQAKYQYFIVGGWALFIGFWMNRLTVLCFVENKENKGRVLIY